MTTAPESTEDRFLRGDPDAVGTVSRWVATVLTDARFLGLGVERLDLHQEVMASVVESLRRERFDRSRDFRRYVQAIARYSLRRAVRARKRGAEQLVAEVEGPDGTDSSFPGLLVQEVLATLPDACRQLILAYFYEQRSYDEIAACQGIPAGTVKSRLFRCLEGAHRILHPASAGRRRSGELPASPVTKVIPRRPRAPRIEPCP